MKGGYYKDLQISVVFICNRGYGSEHVTVNLGVYGSHLTFSIGSNP